MNRYIAVSKTAFKSILNYRASVFLLILQSTVQFIITIFLWKAVFVNSQTISGYNFREIIQYYFGITILSYFCFYAVDWEINEDIHSGNISNILLKPVSIHLYYFFRMIGDRAAHFFFTIIPVSIIALYILKGQFKVNMVVLACLSVFLAMVLWFFLSISIAILAFWIENIFFILTVKEILVQFFSGMLIPISFFPKVIQHVLGFLPFPYIAYEPMQIFTGVYSLEQAIRIIAIQLVWIIILFFFSKYLLNLGLKKYVNVSG